MKKITLIIAFAIAAFTFKAQQKWYISMSIASQPWGTPTNTIAMNQAFGTGAWNQGQYSTVNVNALFQPSVCLIFLEGGCFDANAMNAFITANMTTIQNWVFNGGRLLINAAPNQGGSINYGFGGMLQNYLPGPWPGSSTNAPGQAGHPIFNGPFLPCGTAFTGNWWCHGYVTGPATPLVVSPGVSGYSLGELNWGAGKAMFGSMTTPNWHAPLTNAANFLANVLTYLYVCCTPPVISVAATSTVICSGQSTTLTATGAGIGGTYTWTAPGTTVTSATAAVSPTATTIFTAAGTNSAGCVGSKTIQIIVNPTPTVVPSNNGPICQGAALNLSVAAVTGGTAVAYAWAGPGSYTANVQNPVLANAQPSNSGLYTVTAVNSFTTGTTCQSSSVTTVGVVPVNQTTVTPSFTLCQAATLSLTAQNSVPPTGYSWSGPSAFTSTLQNPVIPFIGPSVAGNYTVTATFTTFGIPLVCTSTAVTNVSVVATSPVTVTIPANICEHTTANLTATTNPPALAYAWTGPNGFMASVSNTSIPNIPAAASGSYAVVATWAIGTVSCTINGFSMMSVVPVNPITINAPVSVCYPGNVNLSANSQGAISYNWTGPNSFTSNLANPVMASPMPVASGIYSVTTAYTNGALVCYSGDTTHVTVNPILPFTLTPYRQVCFNSTYNMSGPAGATSYSWIGSSGVTSTNQVLSIPSIQAPQAGDYTLTVLLGPCSTSASTKVDVLSPISFTNTPGDAVICAGDSVKLTMGSKGGSGNYAYVWNPQIYLGSPTGSVQYGHPDNTTIYNVYGYDISCPDYSVSTAFTVTVNRAPQPDLKLDKNQGCQPLCLVYNSRTQNDATSITYDFGNGNIMQADSFAYCINDPGTYNLQIATVGKNGCKAIYSHTAPIVVWPTPHSDVNWTPEQPTTTNNHVTFDPTNQYGNVVKYNWQFQGSTAASGYDTAATRNPIRTYENVGKYPLVLISTTDKGCIDTVFKVLEIRDEYAIFIPNTFTPNGDGLNDIFNIKGIGLKTDGYTMEIYDRWGSLIYSTKDVMKGWDGTVKGLNAENGVYVYKVKAVGANGEGKKEYVGHVSLLR